jgi:ribonucleoside-diphosphate reductase alpha chain
MQLPHTIKKREGHAVPFDPDKIYRAVHRCLREGVGATVETSGATAQQITDRVLNLLQFRKITNPTVEDIQNLVIEQLWAAGYPEAATAYTLFRAQRAQTRTVRPIDPLDAERIRSNHQFFQTPIQEVQFYDKYSRWSDTLGRRETWEECVTRTVDFLYTQTHHRAGPVIPQEVWTEVQQAMLEQASLPSMRVLQMAGPALERCNAGAYNCSYVPLDTLFAFAELLYILMQGTGAGYSVEHEYVDRLPRIKRQRTAEKLQFTIPDSTEGWCDALHFGLQTWFEGRDVEFDYTRIRPQGARLKTKGGRASGPDPLRQLLDFTRDKVVSRQGSRLSSVDAHDIACLIGDIVQVGGVRRAALISLFDPWDEEMRRCKAGAYWNTAYWRGRANNSIVFEEKPTPAEFMEIWKDLMTGGTGEPGLFNREGTLKKIPERRRKLLKGANRNLGLNPCGEINLRPRGFCNLSIVVARYEDTEDTLLQKIRIAAILGTLQSQLTDFRYLSPDWKKNAEEERLLGVDITGQMDCPLLRPGAPGREDLLRRLKEYAVEVNRQFAELLGIPASAAVTCVKPSGNSAQLLNCSSGIHPRYALYYIRRLRIGAYTPIGQLLKESGIPWFPEVGQDQENPSTLVFEFPVRAPAGSLTRHDLTALQQLENWKVWKQHYTEHNPSITVYVSEPEWIEVMNWVYSNWEWVGGISFLPRDGGLYQLAPYQEITEAEWLDRSGSLPELDWAKLAYFEVEDQTTSAQEFACTGAAGCEL